MSEHKVLKWIVAKTIVLAVLAICSSLIFTLAWYLFPAHNLVCRKIWTYGITGAFVANELCFVVFNPEYYRRKDGQ
jgi:hypothetical protein